MNEDQTNSDSFSYRNALYGIFSKRSLVSLSSIFLISFLLLNITRQVMAYILFPNSDVGRLFFPIGVGVVRFPAPLLSQLQYYGVFSGFGGPERLIDVQIQSHHILIALASISILFIGFKYINPSKYFIKIRLYLLGVLSVIITTAIQGIYQGFIYPISGLRGGKRTHYYHDAESISSVYHFISNFNQLQPELLIHSQTHPPGAVLVYYGLQQIVENPIFVGISILLISLTTVFYLYELLEDRYDSEIATSVTTIFIFLPPVQVYFYSSLDALIAFLILGTIFHYIRWQENRSFLHLSLLLTFLILTFSITVLAVFSIGIFVLHQLDAKLEHPKGIFIDGIKVTIPILTAGSIVYLTTGFDYISFISTASAIESAKYGGGFYAISSPISYIATRIENVAEIILFFGPFCTFLICISIRTQLTNISRFGAYGVVVTLLLFIMGTPRTGETARVFLFLYPLLLFLVADYLYNKNINFIHYWQLIGLVWIQSILMQLFGSYLW